MRARRVILIIIGSLVLVVGAALSAGGGTLLWANATQRDATGYFTSAQERFHASGSALTSDVNFGSRPGPSDLFPYHHLGTLRVTAKVSGADTFVGVAPAARVNAYLAGVAHSEVTGVDLFPFRAHYRNVGGTARPDAPGTQSFWATSSSGPGTRVIVWPTEPGKWTVVVMRGDGHAGVTARVALGAKAGWVQPLGVGLAVGGGLLLTFGALMFVLGVVGLARRREKSFASHPEVSPPAPARPVGAYPARLDGELDSSLSRWRWLVKWFLAIPHFFVLAILWTALVPVTFVAGLAILFTGQYPRGLFDFSVGVLRWTWRVTFYAFSALGTDRYPPFTLDPRPDYPAHFDVDYPASLSRGLVLVKWWLLAIPQYIVVGILAGDWNLLGDHSHHWWTYWGGGGLISLVVIIAAIVLGVTGRYPPDLFSFVMGLNRWCYRVLAYVLLLRDEYPPFRYDGGGADPGSIAVVPDPPPPEE
jgi:hypothetical protein